MVTPASVQSLIINEVGDTLDGLLAQAMPTIWASYADKAYIWPRLQELYSRRRALEFILSTFENHVDFAMSGDLSLHLSDRSKLMERRIAKVQAEIDTEECKARAMRIPVVLPIAATTIEVPPELSTAPLPLYIDANDPVYHGDPYLPQPVVDRR